MAGHRVTARRTQQHKSTSPSPSPRALRHAVAHRRVSASLSGTPSGPAPAHVQSKRPAKARRLCGEAKRSHHPASSHHNPGWMPGEAPGRRRRPGSWLQSASTRPLCEYGSCQCTRLTDVSSEAGLCLITAVLDKTARYATRAGEADFLKRS